MDKIWVLLSEDGDGNINSFEGLFSTKESAVEKVKELFDKSVYSTWGEFHIRPVRSYGNSINEFTEIPDSFECGYLRGTDWFTVQWEIRLEEIK